MAAGGAARTAETAEVTAASAWPAVASSTPRRKERTPSGRRSRWLRSERQVYIGGREKVSRQLDRSDARS
jgi:hypothetical protein